MKLQSLKVKVVLLLHQLTHRPYELQPLQVDQLTPIVQKIIIESKGYISHTCVSASAYILTTSSVPDGLIKAEYVISFNVFSYGTSQMIFHMKLHLLTH